MPIKQFKLQLHLKDGSVMSVDATVVSGRITHTPLSTSSSENQL